MCGIAGVLNMDREPASVRVVQRMTEALVHRGPDAQGVYVDGQLGFGQRRLAIIDTSSAGEQPMVTADGRFVVNYNGELFNFQELRAQLQALGHRFRSSCDSEVVLEALAEWGLDALNRFNGMFALALWDTHERALLLARDRYGIKPLYHATVGRSLLFASEVKAFLPHPDFRVDLDRRVLLEYLTFQNVFTEGTLFAGVSQLPPGTWMRITADGRIQRHQYWDFDFVEPEGDFDVDEAEEELDRLFRQAVGRQLVSDVPLGCYLSGGVDSGSITAVASRQIPDMRTFTVGFDVSSASGIEANWDERDKAEHLSYLFGTEHYEMVLKAGDLERSLPQLVWHLEDLRVGQSYPNFYAAKLASRFGKVVLSGAGGDELFGGYPWRYYRAESSQSFEGFVDDYYLFWQRLTDNTVLKRMFAPVASEVADVWTRDILRDVFTRHAPELRSPADYINHSLYFEAKTFLPGLLIVEDKLSMAHGLETRVPFLDNDLVDFAQRVPARAKLGVLGPVERINENEPGKSQKFFERTRDGKLLLRRVMARHVPQEVSTRAKQGFAAPDAGWYRGESQDYVRRMLLTGNPRLYDYLDRSTVQELVQEHLDGRANRRLLIWSLLSLEQWCRIFLDGQVPSPLPGRS